MDHLDGFAEFKAPSAKLILQDGRIFNGYSFGYPISTSGEVVFNTGMVGYPEALTDPSYCGQILTLTFPIVGNYGVAEDILDDYGLPKFFEGTSIYVKGLVIADYSYNASHYSSRKTLAQWLWEHKIPAIGGIDTRAVTKHIRQQGAMLGQIVLNGDIPSSIPFDDPNTRNLVEDVSCKTIRVYKSKGFQDMDQKNSKILAIDCGMKLNIIRHFLNQTTIPLELTIVPWDDPFGDRDPNSFDGLFLSNGPGDPTKCEVTIQNIRKVMGMGKPIFGICLGNQLLALASGAKTYKMKFGNRGMNQPVVDLRTTRCYITPQNHGYAVDADSLAPGWKEVFINANDRTNEGIIHTSMPWLSVQFHPEACGGPTDTWFLFQQFLYQIASGNRSPPVHTIPINFPFQRLRVLLLGSGGLSIGQAGEFDYSGSQAIKALKESNLEVILVNPNIATVQTSSHLADRVYFLPVLSTFVEKIIRREKPQGILCGFGGQTALNCAVELHRRGVLQKYQVEVLGTPIDSIIQTEDRDLFAKKLTQIGEKCAPSFAATTLNECYSAGRSLGYPVLVRAAFALGGLGSGFAADEESLIALCKEAFSHSKQVLIDKSLRGWKEVEYEVVRDCKDNCITVCNMENFDPLGIHTGDSIVVAPSQTLSNNEFYKLREVAINVVRQFGIIGECNVQYAVDPNSDDYFIVEVNARLSRSSALASKATGYPLAYVAAKLALGIDLLQIRNAVTRTTSACFEPALDYVVTKVPRWDLSKFAYVDKSMGSSMKSVGEVMAIGRTFEESLQKALRMVDESAVGFNATKYSETSLEVLRKELKEPSPARIWAIARAFSVGMTVDEIFDLTRIDRWFLAKLYRIYRIDKNLSEYELEELGEEKMRVLKILGFSDRHIAASLKTNTTEDKVRAYRISLHVRPYVKQIDTLAAEYPASTNYLYLTYQGIEYDVESLSSCKCLSPEDSPSKTSRVHPADSTSFNNDSETESRPSASPSVKSPLFQSPTFHANLEHTQRGSIIVLGCGCYRIGSSVEFDWSAMSCVRTLRGLGHKSIVINCNPETVSTDYDQSDRLFFEVLDLETVLEIWEFEQPEGVVVSVGGQTPNNLSIDLDRNGVCVLGTSVRSIDQAEDRHKFSQLCDSLNIDQPAWSAFTSLEAASSFAASVGYPVLVRPSYVLSGAAMRVVIAPTELKNFLMGAALVNPDHPVVISKYIDNAKEVEMDAVACDGDILNYAISEHVENAGVHSGDATLILPGQKLYVETIRVALGFKATFSRQVRKISQKIAKALQISGPFNIQFICKNNTVKVIECNLRASRTFPFISKTFNFDFIELATRVMVKAPVRSQLINLTDLDFVGVKAPVFSFTRLRRADPMLGVEMRSTGEVACFGTSKYEALLKALLASGFKMPDKTALLSVGSFNAKVEFLPAACILADLGFTIYATPGTYEFLKEYNQIHNEEEFGKLLDDHATSRSALLFKTGTPDLNYSIESPKRHPTTLEDQACSDKETNKPTVSITTPTIGHFKDFFPISTNEDNKFVGKLVKAHKPMDGMKPDAVELVENRSVSIVINISGSLEARSSNSAGYHIRRAAVNCGVPLITDANVAKMFVEALQEHDEAQKSGKAFWEIRSWDEYVVGL